MTNSSCRQSTLGDTNYEQDRVGTIEEAVSLIENHKENEAIEIVNYLIKNSTDSLSYLHFLKGMALYRLQDFQLSLNSIEKSISVDSLNYRSYVVKGDIFQKTSEFDSALVYYEKAAVGLSNDQYLLNNIGTLYTNIGRLYDAKKIYHRLDMIEPNSADYLYNFSFVYYKLGGYDIALTIVERAIAIRHDDAGLYNLKGQILGKKGNIEEAIKSFETSVRLKPHENNAVENLRRVKLHQSK
jgi:tetratricopeptide (TPR) repeat protein